MTRKNPWESKPDDDEWAYGPGPAEQAENTRADQLAPYGTGLRLKTIECTCDHPAEYHDFDTGCSGGDRGTPEEQVPFGCGCEWYQ